MRTDTLWYKGNQTYRDESISPTNSMWKTCPVLSILSDPVVAFQWYNDFYNFTTTQEGLTSTISDVGSTAIYTTDPNGVIELQCSDASVADNDETYVGGTNVGIYLGASKSLWFEARVKFSEANSDDANIIVGLTSTSASAADSLQNNGGGPPANYSGLVWYKVDGGTVWNCEASAGASQTTQTSVITRESGSWARLGIYVESNVSATFYYNGEAKTTISSTLPTSAMSVLIGVKNGDTNEEKLYCDYFKIVQLR